ncbi:MAG: PKD domain-containing protein [Thermoplasmata archaeon]|nr:MAG: PKD domain-containing protein [Thermoplasmata archaeon]
MEFPYGSGYIIASTQTLEHGYWYDYSDILENIILYHPQSGFNGIIPGPGYSTWVYYYFVASDSANNTDFSAVYSYYADGLHPVVVDIGDVTGPVATNAQVSIFANVTDDFGLNFNNTYLWYDNGTGWTSKQMSFISGNYTNATFQAYIPAAYTEATVSYYVQVMDNASNSNVSITKNYLANFPPFIDNIISLPEYPNGTCTVTVLANITDSDGISVATLYYSIDGVTYTPTPMSIFSGNLYNGTIPQAAPAMIVYYYIKAVDANGFENVSSIYNYTIDYQPPIISVPTIKPPYPNITESVNVSFLLDDNSEIDSAVLYYSYDGIIWLNTTVNIIGDLGVIIFNETFPTSSINSSNWASMVSSPIISTMAFNEPTPPYSLELDGTDDIITSVFLDLSNYYNISINFSYEMGGGGNPPEPNDWLYLEYYTSGGSWVNLWSRNGDGMSHSTFENIDISLPTDAYHTNFRFRFRSWGGSGDDFYIDNIKLVSNKNAYATIPGPGYPSKVYYYMDAKDKTGNVMITSTYSYLVGSDLTLSQNNITFSPSPVQNRSQGIIYANIFNMGAALNNVEVRFYLGNPDVDKDNIIDSNAIEIGTPTIINIESNNNTLTSTTWIPPDIGSYKIYVWADAVNCTWEFNEEDNLGGSTLSVFHWVDTFDNLTKIESRQNITLYNSDALIQSGPLDGRNWTKQGMVMDIGAPGEPDDIDIMDHSVIKDEDGTYKLWYTGYGGSNYQVLYAESHNGISWTKMGVVLDKGAPGQPDDVEVRNPTVIKDSDAIPSKRYKMWYTGYDSPYYHIMYATSPDGITWTKQGVVMDEGSPGEPDYDRIMSSIVIKDSGGNYKMWYNGYDGSIWRICYASSSDGLAWSKQGMVLDIGSSGTLDDRHVHNPSIIMDENNDYHMWYSGYDGSRYRTLYAASSDGINWFKHGLAVDLGISGTYDDYYVYGPCVIKDNDGYYKMWYSGDDGSNMRLMYATLPANSIENCQYDFDASDEGFFLESNQPYSSVFWDSGNDNVYFLADRQDANDEMFVKYLPKSFDENSASWTLSARFMLTSMGGSQYPIPLFIGDSSNTNIQNMPNTICFYVDTLSGYARAKYFDSTGIERIYISNQIGQGFEYHVKARYDMTSKRLTLQILDMSDNVLKEGSYLIGTSPSDGFIFGKLGVGTDGYSGSSTIDCIGWTDDINFDFIYENGTLVSNPITLQPDLTWYELFINKTEPGNTYIKVTILDSVSGEPIPGFIDLTGDYIYISGINRISYPSIKLVANFIGNSSVTPILHYWAINWIPPVNADAGSDDYVNEDVPYMFNGSGSWSSLGIVNYAWDINASDGVDWNFPDYEGSDLWNPIHTFNTPGIYTVTINVTDIYGNWDTDTMILTVYDTTPPFILTNGDAQIDEDAPYTFSADGSWDNSGYISSYLWDIDESNGFNWNNPDYNGVSPRHIYHEPGTYTVSLNVSDAAGNWNITTITIMVKDITEPIPDAGFDGSINEDDMYYFDGSSSTDNVGIVFYNWTFGDGGYDFGTNITTNHTYKSEGRYVVFLKVTDEAGNWEEDSLTIYVNNILPVAEAGPNQTVNEGELVTFDGGDSWDTPSDTLNLMYIWYYGDGFIGAGKVTTHIYTAPGTYIVTLMVNDDNGATSYDILTITVMDGTSPVANAGPDDTVDQNSPYIFDGSDSFDNVGIANYTWDVDANNGIDWKSPDYSGSNLWNPVHTFAEPGVYTVTLNITDGSGYWDIDHLVITVKDVTPPIVEAGQDDWAEQNMPYRFDGSKSTDNIGIVTYLWDMDSGNGIDWSSPDYVGPSPAHVYTESGIYIVTLKVIDSHGNSATDTVTLTVNETLGDDTVPRAPTELEVLLLPRNDVLELTWKVPISNKDGSQLTDLDHFEIYYRAGETHEYKKLSDVSAGTTSYVHSGLTTNAIYYYYIVAVDANSTLSSPSMTVSGMPNVDTDGDQIPDITDTDDDNDGHPDSEDEYPLDSTKWKKSEVPEFDWIWFLIGLIVVLLCVIGLLVMKIFKGEEKEPKKKSEEDLSTNFLEDKQEELPKESSEESIEERREEPYEETPSPPPSDPIDTQFESEEQTPNPPPPPPPPID